MDAKRPPNPNKVCPECRGPLTAIMNPPESPDYWIRIDEGAWDVSTVPPSDAERPMVAVYECRECDLTLRLLTSDGSVPP
jgi:hypothetical protein